MGPRSWADQNVEGLAAGMAWLPSGQATYRRRAAACRAGLTHPPSAGLMVVPGGTISSMRSSTHVGGRLPRPRSRPGGRRRSRDGHRRDPPSAALTRTRSRPKWGAMFATLSGDIERPGACLEIEWLSDRAMRGQTDRRFSEPPRIEWVGHDTALQPRERPRCVRFQTVKPIGLLRMRPLCAKRLELSRGTAS